MPKAKPFKRPHPDDLVDAVFRAVEAARDAVREYRSWELWFPTRRPRQRKRGGKNASAKTD